MRFLVGTDSGLLNVHVLTEAVLNCYLPSYQGLDADTVKLDHSGVNVNHEYSYHGDVLFGF